MRTQTKTIAISDRALEEFKKLDVGGDTYLRVSVITGGCSGMTYEASVDTEKTDKDTVVYETDDFKVICEESQSIFLYGLEIDYSDDLISSGFRYKNPNAKKSCGCGASFQF